MNSLLKGISLCSSNILDISVLMLSNPSSLKFDRCICYFVVNDDLFCEIFNFSKIEMLFCSLLGLLRESIEYF